MSKSNFEGIDPIEDDAKTMSTRLDNKNESYINRVVQLFGESYLEQLSHRDYPKMKKQLGWDIYTCRTVLLYMGRNVPRYFSLYTPTTEEKSGLSRIVSASLITTLALTGCLFEELWHMEMDDEILTIHKGVYKEVHSFQGCSSKVIKEIRRWVTIESKYLSIEEARKRWIKAERLGLVSIKCNPGTFKVQYRKMRALTELLLLGEDMNLIDTPLQNVV